MWSTWVVQQCSDCGNEFVARPHRPAAKLAKYLASMGARRRASRLRISAVAESMSVASNKGSVRHVEPGECDVA